MTEKPAATATSTVKKPTKPRATRTTTTRKTAAKAATSTDSDGPGSDAGQTPAVRAALRKARARVAETNTAKSEPERDNPSPKVGRQSAPSRKSSGKPGAPAVRNETPARTGKPRTAASAPAARDTGAGVTPPAATDPTPTRSGPRPDGADSGGTPPAVAPVNVAGEVAASPDPDNTPTTVNPTTNRQPAAAAGRPAAGVGRRAHLGRGELRGMVQDRLYVNPDSEYTAGELSRELGHSSGAIFNALVKLCDLDVAIQTAEKPKTFAWATDTRRRAGIRPTRHPIGAATEAVLAAASQPPGNTQPDSAGVAPNDTPPDEGTDAGADEG